MRQLYSDIFNIVYLTRIWIFVHNELNIHVTLCNGCLLPLLSQKRVCKNLPIGRFLRSSRIPSLTKIKESRSWSLWYFNILYLKGTHDLQIGYNTQMIFTEWTNWGGKGERSNSRVSPQSNLNMKMWRFRSTPKVS